MGSFGASETFSAQESKSNVLSSHATDRTEPGGGPWAEAVPRRVGGQKQNRTRIMVVVDSFEPCDPTTLGIRSKLE